jgi:hypothetical protein
MGTLNLPQHLKSLVEDLQIVQITWQGVPIQFPKFAVYAVLNQPVYDKLVYRGGRQIGLIQFGRYTVPVLDPFRADIDLDANYAIIISHSRGNRFGLYGFTADHVEYDISIPFYHGSVARIVKDYV